MFSAILRSLLFSPVAVSALSGSARLAAAQGAEAPDACAISQGARQVRATVRVQDASGAVLSNAAVELRCGTTVVSGITDSKGEVSLATAGGRYALTGRAPGFADTAQTVELTGTNEPLVLILPVGSATDVISVSADTGFVPFASNAASKTNALLIEVPQSVSVVTQREMEARNVITMNEALRYTPGVQADEFGVEPRFDWLQIRGFAAQTFGVYRDGMRFNSLAGKLDPAELESVEVLKGPSSVLYGEVPPGGLINQVTKRPEAERHTSIEGTFGSFSRRQGVVDTTGSFDRGATWRYRLVGLVRNSGTQTDFTPDNRRLIAPSLSWHPSDRTNITVLSDWQHDGNRWSQFLPSSGTLFNSNPNGTIPRSLFLGEPGLEFARRDQASIGYTGDHLFADGWNVHSNYRFQFINFNGRTFYGNGFDSSIPGNTSLVARSAYAYTNGDHLHTVDTRALRRFAPGSNWEHTVLFGYDYQHIGIRETDGFAAAPDINAFAPVYSLTAFPDLFFYLNNNTRFQQHGLYGQDQIKFKHRLIVTLGGRQDFAKNAIANLLPGSTNFSHDDQRFTGRAGVTWLTDAGVAPYFAYSTSFLPNAGSFVYNASSGQSTTPAKPSDARQIEGGVKVQPHIWNGFFTASVFQINETDVLVSDAAFNTHQSGEVRSRGVELEGVANVGKGWNLHGGYTFTATDTVSDVTPGNIGKWLPQTPRNQVSALADYAMPEGRLGGLGGNFGVRFVGTNAADSANSFFVPNYALLDGSLRFTLRHTLFSVNATNLTDRRYVATCSGLSYCYYGYERNILGSAKYRF